MQIGKWKMQIGLALALAGLMGMAGCASNRGDAERQSLKLYLPAVEYGKK